MMIPVWILLLFLFKTGLVQATNIMEQATMNKPGKNITLLCTFGVKSSDKHWFCYKQRLNQEPEEVGLIGQNKMAILSPPFIDRFIITRNFTTVSLTIQNATKYDAATYFCVEADGISVKFFLCTCTETGQTEFNQTDLDSTKPARSNCFAVEPIMICLGAALGVCVAVITAQAIIIWKMKNHSNDSVSSNSARPQQVPVMETTTNQTHEPVELNYAALHFNERKPRRGQEKRTQPEHSVYSEVKHYTVTAQHLDY